MTEKHSTSMDSQEPAEDEVSSSPYQNGAAGVRPVKRLEHLIKRLSFWLLRLFMRRGRDSSQPLDNLAIKRVLFLRPETKLGDMAISLPTIDCLHQHHPGAEVSIMCSPRNAVLIEDDPRFQKIYLYRKRIFSDIAEVIRARRQKFDLVVDLLCDDSITSLCLAQWIGRKQPIIGTAKIRFADHYDCQSLTPFDPGQHIILNTIGILRAIGIDQDADAAPPHLSPARRTRARQFLDSMKLAEDETLVGLNLSAGQASRDWGVAKSIALTKSILAEHPNIRIVVLTTPDERTKGEHVVAKGGLRTTLIPDCLDILTVTAIISHLQILITPDTAVVHLARAYQVPVVAMLPGHPRNLSLWGPFGQRRGSLVSRSPENIFDISVAQVASEFKLVFDDLRKNR